MLKHSSPLFRKTQVAVMLLVVSAVCMSAVLGGGGVALGAGIDMDFKGADIRDVLQVLGQVGNLNVVTDPDVTGTVTVYLRDMDVGEAIDLVVKTSGYSHRVVGGTLVVGPQAQLDARFSRVDTVFFPLQHIAPDSVRAPLELMVQPATVYVDTVNQGLLVRGTEEQIARARAFLQERDVKRPLEMDFIDADVVSILRRLAVAGGYNLIASADIGGKLTMFLRDVPVQEAIELVARQAGLEIDISGTNVFVSPRTVAAVVGLTSTQTVAEAQAEEPTATGTTTDEVPSAAPAPERRPAPEQVRVFPLYHVAPEQVRHVIAMIVGGDRVHAGEADRTVLVRGTEEQLGQVAALVQQYDAPAVRVDGVVLHDGGNLAVLSIGARSYVVKEGGAVQSITVESISTSTVTLRTGHGRLLSVPVGGSD